MKIRFVPDTKPYYGYRTIKKVPQPLTVDTSSLSPRYPSGVFLRITEMDGKPFDGYLSVSNYQWQQIKELNK
jgi:hypothetical protein